MEGMTFFPFRFEKTFPPFEFKDIHQIEIGRLPKKQIYKDGSMTVYRYEKRAPQVKKPPLLIVFSLLGRPYILDLMEECSLIQDLLDQGIKIYLIDWGFPTTEDFSLSLSHYINTYIANAVKAVQQNSRSQKVHLMGVCQGGVLSLCYAALHPQDIKTLIAFSTPVDFHTPEDVLSHSLRPIDIDLLVQNLGNISGAMITQALMILNPFRSVRKRFTEMNKIHQDPSRLARFLSVEKWSLESPDQTGVAFGEFVKEFYQNNNLIKGKIKIGAQKIDLKKLNLPILNILASKDALVPPNASLALEHHVGSQDIRTLQCDTGHIGLYINDEARAQVASTVHQWIMET